jgi:hypothetical protein
METSGRAHAGLLHLAPAQQLLNRASQPVGGILRSAIGVALVSVSELC